MVRLKLLLLAAVATLGTFGCKPNSSEFESYRSAIAHDMLDPSSAQFRNEKIRTLWTEEGSRLKLYCAEVNGMNSFGGKTGFIRAVFVIESKSVVGENLNIFKNGYFSVNSSESPDEYMNCKRPDTQRKNRSLLGVTPWFGPFDANGRHEIDKANPVISTLPAPEDR